MATSQRLLAIAIFGLLVAGFVTVAVKDSEEEPLVIPTTSPTPTETFTFPGPIPTATDTDTGLFPTETETPSEPGPEPTETMTELPKTGDGSLAMPALLTLALGGAGAFFVRRSARSNS